MLAYSFRRLLLCTAAACTSLLSALGQDAWPQFRGPGARGVSTNLGLPDTWSAGTNIAWKTAVPGMGWSSPIIWGDQVIVTTAVSEGEVEAPRKGLYFGGERPPTKAVHQWRVLAYALSNGKLGWQTVVRSGPPPGPRHLKNSHASETPVTDGEHVYAFFGNAGLYCLDMKGRLVWSESLGVHEMRYGWGTSSSPVLHGDRIYIVRDNQDQSFMVALDKRTGKEVWRVERDEPSNFSTPFVWENGLRTELVTTGVNRTRSYDLEGRLLWEFGPGMSEIVIPTPFTDGGLLYVCAGYVGDKHRVLKPVYAIRPGAAGDIGLPDGETSNEFIAWRRENAAPYNPTPVLHDGRFYTLWDFGFLSCYDARTGAEIYDKQRIKTDGIAGFTASPWAYDGKIFCLSEDGDTYVIAAGDEYRLLHVNSLEEMCMATPAIAGKTLVIRGAQHLFGIRGKD
ncbi:MAG TPA: serine/threonine protein kinase [Verrucomicrobiales bacterium]|nr:serine/threonine protein kinase [Verrucomicrobiales bacterium]